MMLNKDVGGEKIHKEARPAWHQINGLIRNEYVHKVKISHIDLHDNLYAVDDSAENEKIFEIKYNAGTRYYDLDDAVLTSVAFEMDLDLQVVSRQVYRFLDVLGDIGGLAGSLKVFFSVIIMFLQYHAPYNYLAEATFRQKDKHNGESS